MTTRLAHQSLVQQRLLAEDLLRNRSSTDADRYVETLGGLDQGGAMLCDEVGLGFSGKNFRF